VDNSIQLEDGKERLDDEGIIKKYKMSKSDRRKTLPTVPLEFLSRIYRTSIEERELRVQRVEAE